MFDRKKYKQFAKLQLKGRWTVPVLMTLVALIINVIFSLPEYINYPYEQLLAAIQQGDFYAVANFFYNSDSQISNTPFILSIIHTLVTFVLTFVCARIYIKLSQSPDKVSFSDYLQNFNYWGRGILVGLWKFLWLIIWSLIILPITFICAFIIVMFETPKIMAGGDINEILIVPTLILTVIILVLLTIIRIVKGLSYSMAELIAAEHEKCTITQALNISKKITKGHKKELFLMYLSFILWYLLCIITLNIASLWVSPYISMTKVNAYHALLKNAFEENLIHVEDFEE